MTSSGAPGTSVTTPTVARSSGKHRARLDASHLLALVGFTTFLIPPRYAVGTAGLSFNSPTLFGLTALLLWGSAQLGRRPRGETFNAVQWALGAYAGVAVLSLGIAFARPLTGGEPAAALRSFAITMGYVGIALLLSEAVRAQAGLQRVWHWTLLGAYLSGLIALGQRVLSLDYVSFWGSLPGVRFAGETDRLEPLLSGRAFGTAGHPIELAVVSGCLIAISVNQATRGVQAWRGLHWVGSVVLLLATMLAISRSGFVALLLVAPIAFTMMSARQRVNSLVVVVASLVAVQVFAHGTLSTLRYQLVNVGVDASSQGRLVDYGPVFEIVDSSPWVGIGLGTFIPDEYFILDNQWLATLVTQGIIGVVALLALVGVTLWALSQSRRRTASSFMSGLSRGAHIGFLAAVVCAYLFDLFAFPQISTVFFLLIGTAGSVWWEASLRPLPTSDLEATDPRPSTPTSWPDRLPGSSSGHMPE